MINLETASNTSTKTVSSFGKSLRRETSPLSAEASHLKAKRPSFIPLDFSFFPTRAESSFDKFFYA